MRAETNNLSAAGGYVGVVKYLENLLLNQRGSLARGGEDLTCERGMEGRTNGGSVCHTECALWCPGTPEHHVKQDAQHVEYIAPQNILLLHQQKHLHVSYILTSLSVNKTIAIRLTLISEVVTEGNATVNNSTAWDDGPVSAAVHCIFHMA